MSSRALLKTSGRGARRSMFSRPPWWARVVRRSGRAIRCLAAHLGGRVLFAVRGVAALECGEPSPLSLPFAVCRSPLPFAVPIRNFTRRSPPRRASPRHAENRRARPPDVAARPSYCLYGVRALAPFGHPDPHTVFTHPGLRPGRSSSFYLRLRRIRANAPPRANNDSVAGSGTTST